MEGDYRQCLPGIWRGRKTWFGTKLPPCVCACMRRRSCMNDTKNRTIVPIGSAPSLSFTTGGGLYKLSASSSFRFFFLFVSRTVLAKVRGQQSKTGERFFLLVILLASESEDTEKRALSFGISSRQRKWRQKRLAVGAVLVPTTHGSAGPCCSSRVKDAGPRALAHGPTRGPCCRFALRSRRSHR